MGVSESLLKVAEFIVEKVREREDPSRRSDIYDYKGAERGREVDLDSCILGIICILTRLTFASNSFHERPNGFS